MILLESPGLFLLIGGFFLSLLMAAGALASRNPVALRWIIAGLFASIALSLLPATAHLLGRPGHWLLGWVGSVASFFSGPFLFQYARLQSKVPPRIESMTESARSQTDNGFLTRLESLPFAMHLIVNGALGLLCSSVDLRPMLSTRHQDFPADLWLSNPAAILGPLLLILYMQWSARKLRPIRPGEAWILQAYCALLLLLVCGLLWLHWLGHTSAALICVLIFVHFVYLQRNPPIATPEKKQSSPWTKAQAQQWKDRLHQTITEERPYLDEDLSLPELAAMISLSTHQLSWLLNDYLGTNFYSYLAQFRIREACEMLRSEQERTILSIAYACGFNSKSSFHSAFKKELGMSPGAFRRSNLEANSERSR